MLYYITAENIYIRKRTNIRELKDFPLLLVRKQEEKGSLVFLLSTILSSLIIILSSLIIIFLA